MTIEIKKAIPMPDECVHPDCENKPVVAVDRKFVCNEHLPWALKPTREILTLAWGKERE